MPSTRPPSWTKISSLPLVPLSMAAWQKLRRSLANSEGRDLVPYIARLAALAPSAEALTHFLTHRRPDALWFEFVWPAFLRQPGVLQTGLPPEMLFSAPSPALVNHILSVAKGPALVEKWLDHIQNIWLLAAQKGRAQFNIDKPYSGLSLKKYLHASSLPQTIAQPVIDSFVRFLSSPAVAKRPSRPLGPLAALLLRGDDLSADAERASLPTCVPRS